MRDIGITLLTNLTSCICAAGAVYLALHDKSSGVWGWFLFAAFCTHTVYTFSEKKPNICDKNSPQTLEL